MPQVCSVGQVGAPLRGVCVLKLLLLSQELPWAVVIEELTGFSVQLFWSTVGTSSGGWRARFHPAPSGWCWEDMAFMEEQEEAAPVSLGSRLSYVPRWDFWPSVLTVSVRRLSQPVSGPWVCRGVVWVQDV